MADAECELASRRVGIRGDHGPDHCVGARRIARQRHREALPMRADRSVLHEGAIRAVDADAATGRRDRLREEKVDAAGHGLERDAGSGVRDDEPGVSRRGDWKERQRSAGEPGEEAAPQ